MSFKQIQHTIVMIIKNVPVTYYKRSKHNVLI